MFNLGVCYAKGEGVSQDWTQATVWWRKAAELGVAEAMFNLGVCYAKGEGVSQDYAEAKHLYEACLAQNDNVALPYAARALARLYREGLGVEKDDATADEYERLADEFERR